MFHRFLHNAARQQPRFTLASTFKRFASMPPRPPPPKSVQPQSTFRMPMPRQARTADSAKQARRMQLARELLETEGQNVLLYTAPKRMTTFRVQNWAAAGLCFGMVWYYNKARMLDMDAVRRQGLPMYVGVLYMIIGFFLSGVGTLALIRNAKLVDVVRLVQKASGPHLQITTRRMVPYLTKSQDISIGQLHYSRFMTLSLGRDQLFDGPELETERPGLASRVGSSISRFFYSIFMSTQQFFSPASVAKMSIVRETEGGSTKTDSGYSVDMLGETLSVSDKSMPYILELATVDE